MGFEIISEDRVDVLALTNSFPDGIGWPCTCGARLFYRCGENGAWFQHGENAEHRSPNLKEAVSAPVLDPMIQITISLAVIPDGTSSEYSFSPEKDVLVTGRWIDACHARVLA